MRRWMGGNDGDRRLHSAKNSDRSSSSNNNNMPDIFTTPRIIAMNGPGGIIGR